MALRVKTQLLFWNVVVERLCFVFVFCKNVAVFWPSGPP